jgi:alpha-amylase
LIKPKPDLRHRSIYQVLTDRFGLDLGLNEDGSDKIVRCDPDERRYCGGTWKGIERRLGYMQGMGFDTGAYECCRYLEILRDVVRA